MGRITPEDVSSRTSRLSNKEKAELETWADFANAGDEEMASHIFSQLSQGAKTVITSLLALLSEKKKKEK